MRRPMRSPSEPNSAAPSGRTIIPIPKVPRLASSAATGSVAGKKRLPNQVASEAKVRKSYHSRKVPKQAETTTCRLDARGGGRMSGHGRTGKETMEADEEANYRLPRSTASVGKKAFLLSLLLQTSRSDLMVPRLDAAGWSDQVWISAGQDRLITALTSSASVRTPIFSMTRARWASTVFMLIAEFVGDLLVQLAGDDQLHHLAFTLGQLFDPVAQGMAAFALGRRVRSRVRGRGGCARAGLRR